jgi:hypothetical protein
MRPGMTTGPRPRFVRTRNGAGKRRHFHRWLLDWGNSKRENRRGWCQALLIRIPAIDRVSELSGQAFYLIARGR